MKTLIMLMLFLEEAAGNLVPAGTTLLTPAVDIRDAITVSHRSDASESITIYFTGKLVSCVQNTSGLIVS